MYRRSMIAVACILSAGCTETLVDPCSLLSTGTECEQGVALDRCLAARFISDPSAEEAITLLDVPTTLQTVLDDRTAFAQDDNPLADVAPGLILDILADVNGCWGRVEEEQFSDESGQWIEAATLMVDLAAGTVRQERMIGIDGFECAHDTRPSIIVFDHEVNAHTDGQLDVTIVGDLESDRTTAGLNDDGSLSFHLRARTGWETSLGNSFIKAYTVSGDFLVTNRTSGGATEGQVDLWKRFTCPE